MSQPLLMRSEMYTTSKQMGQYEETGLYLILEFFFKNEYNVPVLDCTLSFLSLLEFVLF